MNEELKVIISADTGDLKKDIDKAEKEIKDFSKESEKASEMVDGAFNAIKSSVSIAMTAAVGVVTAATAAIVGVTESTRDYRNAQAKLNTAFKTAGSNAKTANKIYKELNGVLGNSDVAVEAASHLAKLTTNEKDLEKWTKICTGVYATFGDSLPIEGLTEAANETAKTGKLTGGLADALNWAGISEEEFQGQLDECTTEQERQKKIMDTLINTYSAAATEFEKTNKEIIEANKATDDWNSAMADIGGAFEPVVTEFKKMGTDILKSAKEPLEGLAEFITDDLIPGIRDAAGWVKDNKDIIIGVITGVTAAIVAYKGATLAAKAAEEGVTAAMWLRHAAQKALNVIMAANPIGLIVGALAGLTAGLVAYGIATSDAEKDTKDAYKAYEDMEPKIAIVKDGVTELYEAEEFLASKTMEANGVLMDASGTLISTNDATILYIDSVKALTDAQIENIEKSREAVDEIREMKTAADENAGAISSEMGYIEDLADELFRLADETGKVQEADEARVKFILGQLNEALDTEYTMVDGVIQQYETLRTSIYDVIAAKTANALLENANEAYIEAIKNEDGALQAVNDSYQNYQNQLVISSEKIEDFKRRKEENEKKLAELDDKAGARVKQRYENAIKYNEEMIIAEEKKVQEAKTAYETDAKNYGTLKNTIINYEEAMIASQEGNYDKVREILAGKSMAYNDYGDDVDETTAKVLDTLYDEAIQAGVEAERTKHNFETGVEGYTEEMVKEAEKGYDDAIKKWEDAYNDAHGIGKDMGSGFNKGLDGTNIPRRSALTYASTYAQWKNTKLDGTKVGEDMGEGVKQGLENKKTGLLQKARNLISSIWSAMRSEADSHSPSRKTMLLGEDLGAGLEIGINDSTQEVVNSARNMINKTIIPIEGALTSVSWNNVGGIFDTSALTAQVNGSIGGFKEGVEDILSIQWVNQLVDAFGANSTPIVLQVDGKTFAQTSVSAINQLTKQTGKLGLNII